MSTPLRSYTTAERNRRARLVGKGIRQGLAGLEVSASIDRQITDIDRRAEERARLEAEALLAKKSETEQALAAAKATERTAGRAERPAARRAVKDAMKARDRAALAVRRAGL